MASDEIPATPPAWFVDELATAGRENLDELHVERYDRTEDADALEEVCHLAELGLTSKTRIIEFGAGTGQFTIQAAMVCAYVTAVDISPVMLQRLATKVRDAGLNNVSMLQSGFLSYVHEAPPVDVIYSRLAMHHLPDFWKAMALARMRAMLCPGGLLPAVGRRLRLRPFDATERIEAWCETAGDAVESEWTRSELEEHVRDEHSTFSWLLEAMMKRTGFDIVQAEHSDDGMMAKYLLEAT